MTKGLFRVRGFLLHALVAVVTVGLLALLGACPRARAGTLHYEGLRPDAEADGVGLVLPDSSRQMAAAPAPPPTLLPRHGWSPPSQLADSPTGPGGASLSSVSYAAVLPFGERTPPPPINLVPAPPEEFIPDPAVASIFHPPRAAGANRAPLPLPSWQRSAMTRPAEREGLCPGNGAGTESRRSLTVRNLLERETFG
jgi:hypothetical protein